MRTTEPLEEARATGSTQTEPRAVATKPSGPAAAALVAAGIGVFILGLMTTLNEASGWLADTLRWSTAVGPLIGKTGVAVIVWILVWIGLGLGWRKRNVGLVGAFAITIILVALGFLLTLPPFFELFAAE
jgi:hypothetical protein